MSGKHGLNWRAVVAGLVIALLVAWFSARPGVAPGSNSEAAPGVSVGAAGAQAPAAGATERQASPTSAGAPAPVSPPAPESASAQAPVTAPPSRKPSIQRAPRPPPEHPTPVAELKRVIPNVTIEARGERPWRGDVDLGPTIDRIVEGRRYPSRNDGSVFQNREQRLPKRPAGYYREYVHPTEGVRGPGPQRIVRGEGGEWYYTPDHYGSFIPLHGPRGP
ncbi:MAG: ribonuclease domain-containing protein [Myxococcota bacterium]